MAEESTTSQTGGRKITKPQQFSLIPPGPLWELAEHFAKGSEKYGAHNVRKGYEWSKMYDAAMRHLTAFWDGEDRDEETGSKHLAAVAFYALLLMEFMETHPEYDDRYKPDTAITNLDVGSFGKRANAETSEDMAEKAQKLWAEIQEEAKRTRRWANGAIDPESGSLIIHESINEYPSDKHVSHFFVRRDGQIIKQVGIEPLLSQMRDEQIAQTTREAYEAWDAGRPFGRFATPTEIREDKE